jgi:hypothetical protein
MSKLVDDYFEVARNSSFGFFELVFLGAAKNQMCYLCGELSNCPKRAKAGGEKQNKFFQFSSNFFTSNYSFSPCC